MQYFKFEIMIRNGIQQKRNSWQDGVYGTNCPIPPGQNFTYNLQIKDQIGSFFYFPSLAFHRAAGGFGGITISSRPLIPVPFPPPAGDFTIIAGDWFKQNNTVINFLVSTFEFQTFSYVYCNQLIGNCSGFESNFRRRTWSSIPRWYSHQRPWT